jgi:flagellar biosynthesis protein FlhF
VEDLVPKMLPLSTVQKVLQNLLTEGVAIRDMRSAARKPRAARAIAERKSAAAATPPGAATVEPPRAWAQDLTDHVIREIQSMRGTLESQLAALFFGDARAAGARAPLFNHMLAAGFSAGFARELLLDLPPLAQDRSSLESAMRSLAARLTTSSTEDEIVKKGGVYALIGPTGVGKTTTTAKIAARCVVRHGVENVALLTTDSYRIAAHEQLRVYGRLLGLPVHTIRDAEDLQTTLAELHARRVVLIDTIGMSQRDRMVAEQSAMLKEGGAEVRQVLLLNATCSAETLHDVVRAYGAGAVRDCIITKADEAATLGAPLEVALRERLVVHYIATGQRVPEDLRSAEALYLARTALDAAAESLNSRMSESLIAVAAAQPAARVATTGAA